MVGPQHATVVPLIPYPVCLLLSLLSSHLPVQLTGELFSAYGVSLGRWTSVWLPRPRPLVLRIISSFMWGPWRALGLVDDTTTVKIPLLDAFHNPVTPPGGWDSAPGYRRFIRRQQQAMQSEDEFGSDVSLAQQDRKADSDEEEEGAGGVPSPRALWLRVTLSGRSFEAGPPRIYSARAKLDVDRGEQWEGATCSFVEQYRHFSTSGNSRCLSTPGI